MDTPGGNESGEAADALVGRSLDGRYRLDAVLARGGMATVYLATDTRLDRVVAVKVMRPLLAEDPDFVDRFAREARSAARLSSLEVVAVHDQGTDAGTGTAFLVMEHVAGGTLRDLVEQGPVHPVRALGLLEPVLRALAAAHAAGLVHRDVKPENVLLGADGRVKVADFGLARAVETSSLTMTSGLLIGTVAYLAPEQVEQGRADPRSDVYAAGIVLFELLTGAPPFDADTPLSVAFRHVHEDVPAPGTRVAGIPTALDDLVVRATRRDPAARPVDAGAFLAELQVVRADLLGPAGPPTSRLRPTLVVPRPTSTPNPGTPPGTPPVPPTRGAPAPDPAAPDPDAPDPDAPDPAAPDRPSARRRRRTAWALALVLLVAAALSGGAYAFGTTATPPVLSLPKAQAEAALRVAGLQVRYEAPRFHEQVPAQQIIDQDPDPNRRVRKGGTVVLLESRGPDRRVVPPTQGTTQAAATAAITKAGLRLGAVTSAFDASPAGTVVASTPQTGQRLRPGTPVALVVSRGPELLDVPAVTGQSSARATRALADAGFETTVSRVFSERVPNGQVVAQEPAEGRAARGSTVSLEVSKGPELFAVPDLRGRTAPQAAATLADLGLEGRAFDLPDGQGNVVTQSPRAGSLVRRGAVVTYYVL